MCQQASGEGSEYQSSTADGLPNESLFVVPDESLTTRRYVRRMLTAARSSRYSAIDLSQVEFVSRSVADELVLHSSQYSVKLVGQSGDVATMIDAIKGNSNTGR